MVQSRGMQISKEARFWCFFTVVFSVLVFSRTTAGACVEPCLYYANASSIKRVQLTASTGRGNSTPFETIYKNGQHIGPIALDRSGQRIFWSDVWAHKIYKAYLNGSMPEVLVEYGMGMCQGLAYDWSTDNIYWTDSLHDWIEVVGADGQNRKVVINGTMGHPRGIAITPLDGYIFWTDFGSNARIERATLNGQNRRAIVSQNLVWPNDLAIDFKAKRIYWIDAYRDKIESTDYSGARRKIHTDVAYNGQIAMHPYSMALFFQHGQAYYTDWYRSTIFFQTMNIGTVIPSFLTGRPFLTKQIGQVKILHSSLQPPASSPCQSNRGFCSHICMKTNATGYECACPTGMKLSRPNGKQCKKVELEYQAILLDGRDKTSRIFHISKYIDEPRHVFATLKLPKSSQLPVGVDFDPKTQTLYWSDVTLDKILKMNINGSGFASVLDRDLRTPEGLALDTASNLLYFADYYKETIEVVKLDGSARKVIISSDLVNPRDVVLYHEKGLMFFSDWGARKPKIESAFLDGAGRKAIISSSIRTPSGLAVDKIEQRLFWADIHLDRIESSDLDGSNRRVLIDHDGYNPYEPIDSLTGEVQTPFGLALFRNKVFWTDWSTRSVYFADKRTGEKITMVSAGFERPKQIHVYSNKPEKEFKKIYLFSHARSSKSITHSCFIGSCKQGVTEDPAMCPPGFKQTQFNKTCAKCDANFGLTNRRCPCKNWMTCAHRAYLTLSCPSNKPYLNFKVRECVQVVNPGFCPAYKCLNGTNVKNGCLSDGDCLGHQKCCDSSCGKKCLNSSKTPIEHACQNKNGGCSHFCFRMPKGFKCDCPSGMILQKADTKTCIRSSGYCAINKPCRNKAVCTDSSTNTYNCTCPPGLFGRQCESCTKCMNGGKCTMVSAGIRCSCTSEYRGDRCQIPICTVNYCQNNGTCVVQNYKKFCRCPFQFTGRKCETKVPCLPNPCLNSGSCFMVGNKTKCNCSLPFTGPKCETATCSPNFCANNGTCVLERNTVRCNCSSSFTGSRCETPTVCVPNPCTHNGTCAVVGGIIRCNCQSSFTGAKCETATACWSRPCANNGTCVADGVSRTCVCGPQYKGMSCEQRRFCYSLPCRNGGLCSESSNDYRCVCRKGYGGKSCEVVSPCVVNPCNNSATCIPVGDTDYRCDCPSGFIGKTCSKIDHCSGKSCQNGGSCINGVSDFKCQCANGYTGQYCASLINHCNGNKCKNQATCINSKTGYTCNCQPGYSGKYCATKVNYCDGTPCLNSGTCINGINSFRCVCLQHYTGLRCESIADLCSASTCLNEGKCEVKEPNSVRMVPYICQCVGNFTGVTCELFYGDSFVQVKLSGKLSDMAPNSEIQAKLASQYTTYCAANDCKSANTSSVARKRRNAKSSVAVTKDDVIIPPGFPRANAANEIEFRYAVVGKKDGASLVLSGKDVVAGLVASNLEFGSKLKVLSVSKVKPDGSPSGKSEKSKRRKNKKQPNPAVLITVGCFLLVVFVILVHYIKSRRAREPTIKFNEVSFENVVYESNTTLNASDDQQRVEIRRSQPEGNASKHNFQFQNMMYAGNDGADSRKVDLSQSGYSLEYESNDGITGVVNPFAELPEEEKKVRYITRTDSTRIVTGNLPAVGITAVDEDAVLNAIQASSRVPQLVGDSDLRETVVRVQPGDPTGFENPYSELEPAADFEIEARGALAATTSNADDTPVNNMTSWIEKNEKELGKIEAGPRNDESCA